MARWRWVPKSRDGIQPAVLRGGGCCGVPLLALVMSPVAAAALLLPVYIVSDMVGLWAYRKEYSPRNLAILIPAMVFGVGLGWATARITEEWMVTLFGSMVTNWSLLK